MADFRSLIPFGRGSLLRSNYDPFTGFRQELDRLFEDFGRELPIGVAGAKGFLTPKVDVAETETGLELTAELPGFDEKDVSLDIHDGVLTIKAEHKAEREDKDEKKHYHVIERSRGTFLRRLALPFEADAAQTSAHMEKGLLKGDCPSSRHRGKETKEDPNRQEGCSVENSGADPLANVSSAYL